MKDQNINEDAGCIARTIDWTTERNALMHQFILSFCSLILFILVAVSGFSQDTQRTYSYKFEVEGINSRKNAKALLMEFNTWQFTDQIDFFEDCDCFKLTSLTPLEYNDIHTFCRENGYTLEPRIMLDDGTLLLAPDENSEISNPE